MDEVNRNVAERLKELRRSRKLSLEDLARRSGVSRAMLSQVETLKTNPTIATLWKVAKGLEVPFSELLGAEGPPAVKVSKASEARFLYSADRKYRSRPLLSQVPGHPVELYELRLEPGTVEAAEPHPAGSFEQVVVQEGRLGLALGEERYELSPGDAILFRADRAHRYEALGKKPFLGLSLILYGG